VYVEENMFSFAVFLPDDNHFWEVLQLFVRGKKFFCPPKRPDVSAYPVSCSVAYQRFFAAVKQPEREVTYSPESSAEMKNELSYTFSLPCVP
jgi:hypothetical protein